MADKPDSPDQPTAAAGQPPATGAQPTVELPQSSQPAQEPAQPVPADGEPAPAADQPARSSAEVPPVRPAVDDAPARSGAEAPPPVTPPAPKRPPRMTKTWIAAVAAGVLLLGGGVAGYAIGAIDRHDRPGWSDGRGPGGDVHWRGGDRGDWGDRGDRDPWNR